MRHDRHLDDGGHWGRDGHEGQSVDASPDHPVYPGVLMITSVVVAGDAGFIRMVATSSVMIPLVVLTVMCNAVRERCHWRGEAGREQDE